MRGAHRGPIRTKARYIIGPYDYPWGTKGRVTLGYCEQGYLCIMKSPMYVKWCNMRINARSRGLEICDRWDCYENFLEDMYEVLDGGRLELDRIDPNRGYFPDNCQGLTPEEHREKSARERRIRRMGRISAA